MQRYLQAGTVTRVMTSFTAPWTDGCLVYARLSVGRTLRVTFTYSGQSPKIEIRREAGSRVGKPMTLSAIISSGASLLTSVYAARQKFSLRG